MLLDRNGRSWGDMPASGSTLQDSKWQTGEHLFEISPPHAFGIYENVFMVWHKAILSCLAWYEVRQQRKYWSKNFSSLLKLYWSGTLSKDQYPPERALDHSHCKCLIWSSLWCSPSRDVIAPALSFCQYLSQANSVQLSDGTSAPWVQWYTGYPLRRMTHNCIFLEAHKDRDSPKQHLLNPDPIRIFGALCEKWLDFLVNKITKVNETWLAAEVGWVGGACTPQSKTRSRCWIINTSDPIQVKTILLKEHFSLMTS